MFVLKINLQASNKFMLGLCPQTPGSSISRARIIPGKSCSFLIDSLSKGLSLYFMCSDQHVKYQIPRVFPFTSNFLLNYHVKQYTHTDHQFCNNQMFIKRFF